MTNILLVLGVVWNSYQGYAFVADRYLYLPGVGLALAAAAGLGELARALELPPRVPTVVLALWCAVLGVATWRQVPVWHDSEALWAYTLAHNPDCLPCHENLALILTERGALDSAAAHYETAERLGLDPKGVLGFGNLRLAQGRLDEAAALYARAERVDPENPKAPYNLGVVLERQGEVEEAIARYQEAVRRDPTWPDPHNNRGVAFLHAGRVAEARTEFEATLRLHPGDVEAELNLGLIAEDGEDWEAAERHYRAAAAAASEERLSIAAHRSLADVLVTRHELGAAIEHYQNGTPARAGRCRRARRARLDPRDQRRGTVARRRRGRAPRRAGLRAHRERGRERARHTRGGVCGGRTIRRRGLRARDGDRAPHGAVREDAALPGAVMTLR